MVSRLDELAKMIDEWMNTMGDTISSIRITLSVLYPICGIVVFIVALALLLIVELRRDRR